MKVKKIIIPKYTFVDRKGIFVFKNVEILIDLNSNITPETFNQDEDDYYISSKEIERFMDTVDKTSDK